MALKRTAYCCNKCGDITHVVTKEPELPPRRCTRRCRSRKCKGQRRWFYPARRPLTGRWK